MTRRRGSSGTEIETAWSTVAKLIAAAEPEEDLRAGMVAVVQTFGDRLSWNPHVHALVSRGGWRRDETWFPVPFVDPDAAQLVFRHEVLKLLRDAGLLDEDRIALLLSWRHAGISVDSPVTVAEDDERGLERLARYLRRPPAGLKRTSWYLRGRPARLSEVRRSDENPRVRHEPTVVLGDSAAL